MIVLVTAVRACCPQHPIAGDKMDKIEGCLRSEVDSLHSTLGVADWWINSPIWSCKISTRQFFCSTLIKSIRPRVVSGFNCRRGEEEMKCSERLKETKIYWVVDEEERKKFVVCLRRTVVSQKKLLESSEDEVKKVH